MRVSQLVSIAFTLFTVSLLLSSCGRGNVKTKASPTITSTSGSTQSDSSISGSTSTIASSLVYQLTANCTNFSVTAVSSNTTPAISESVQVTVSFTPCTGDAKYLFKGNGQNLYVTGPFTFNQSFSALGANISKYSIAVLDAKGTPVTEKEASITFNVLPCNLPTPTPTPVAPIVSIGRVPGALVTALGAPMKIRINITGSFSTLLLNNQSAAANTDLFLAPLSSTSNLYRAVVDVTYLNGAMPIHLESTFEIPKCTLAVNEVTADYLKSTVTLIGQLGSVAQLFVENMLVIPLSPSTQTSVLSVLPIVFSPGDRVATARVINFNGDTSVCNATYHQNHIPVSTAAGTLSVMRPENGYSVSGPRGILMGGGHTLGTGNWAIIPGSASADIVTNTIAQRTYTCSTNEVAVGIEADSTFPSQPWSKLKCAKLVAGLETYSPRNVYVAWSNNSNGSCSTGEALTGTGFEYNAAYGEFGARLVLQCSKIGWTSEHN